MTDRPMSEANAEEVAHTEIATHEFHKVTEKCVHALLLTSPCAECYREAGSSIAYNDSDAHALSCKRWFQYDDNHKRYIPDQVCTCGAADRAVEPPTEAEAQSIAEPELRPFTGAEAMSHLRNILQILDGIEDTRLAKPRVLLRGMIAIGIDTRSRPTVEAAEPMELAAQIVEWFATLNHVPKSDWDRQIAIVGVASFLRAPKSSVEAAEICVAIASNLRTIAERLNDRDLHEQANGAEACADAIRYATPAPPAEAEMRAARRIAEMSDDASARHMPEVFIAEVAAIIKEEVGRPTEAAAEICAEMAAEREAAIVGHGESTLILDQRNKASADALREAERRIRTLVPTPSKPSTADRDHLLDELVIVATFARRVLDGTLDPSLNANAASRQLKAVLAAVDAAETKESNRGR